METISSKGLKRYQHTVTLAKAKKLKEKIQNRIDFLISMRAEKILEAQTNVALGTHKMLRLELDEAGMPHRRTVSDEREMQNLLDTGIYGKDYIIIVGKAADWKAGNALLDRAFGKANESVKHTGEVVFSLRGLANTRKNLDVDNDDITDEQ